MNASHSLSKSDFSEICYKKNFLTEVIARVDFLNPLPGIDKTMSHEVVNAISKYFPISEPKTTIKRNIKISPKGIEESSEKEIKEWTFHGKDHDKFVTLIEDAYFVKYTTFKSFEILLSEFISGLSKIFDINTDIQARRLGLRYINNLKINIGDPLDWEELINPSLIQTLKFSNNKSRISRAFNVLEFSYEDFNLRFQFGNFNPDFPARIIQKQFILDFDTYFEGIQSLNDITNNLDKFHHEIQIMFESSIKDPIRALMNE